MPERLKSTGTAFKPMARAYRWLGGVGYILGLIPYVNAISPILVAIAWIMMGRDTRERVFTALGVLLMALFATGIIMVLAILALIPMGMMGPRATPIIETGALLGILLAVVIVVLAALVIAALILDVIAHFRAARVFDSRWFRLGGWLRIGAAIALVISIPLIVINMLSAGARGVLGQPAPGALPLWPLPPILWPLIIAVIISLLATISSIIAFFTIPEEAT